MPEAIRRWRPRLKPGGDGLRTGSWHIGNLIARGNVSGGVVVNAAGTLKCQWQKNQVRT